MFIIHIGSAPPPRSRPGAFRSENNNGGEKPTHTFTCYSIVFGDFGCRTTPRRPFALEVRGSFMNVHPVFHGVSPKPPRLTRNVVLSRHNNLTQRFDTTCRARAITVALCRIVVLCRETTTFPAVHPTLIHFSNA